MSDVLIRTVGKSIKIETVLAAGLWPAFADPSHVDNAIMNLAINARDAMPEAAAHHRDRQRRSSTRTMRRVRGTSRPGQFVMLAVSDNGTGMPPTFGAASSSRSSPRRTWARAPASGSPRSTVSSSSPGALRIYSEPGQGTTVKIYLPRLTDASLIAAAPEIQEPSRTPYAHAGEVVLFVEDDDGVRDFARSALESLGYTVIAGSDGVEGLALLREAERVDVLFTDVALPRGMNGRKLPTRRCN